MVVTPLLLLLVLALLLPVATSSSSGRDDGPPFVPDTDDVTVPGGGTSSVMPLVRQWCNTFQTVKADRSFPYALVGSAGGTEGVQQGTLTWAVSMIEPPPMPTVKHFTLLDAPLVVAYNLPMLQDPLTLPIDVVALIFAANITRWNDARICAANAHVCHLLPDALIFRVVVEDAGPTVAFTEALAKAASPGIWPLGTISQWPTHNNTFVTSTLRAGGVVLVRRFSITYLCKLWSNIFSLKAASLYDSRTAATHMTAAADATWPLMARHYMLINVRASNEQLSHALRFVRWAVLDRYARSIASSLGFVLRPMRDGEALIGNLSASITRADSNEPVLRVSNVETSMAPFVALMVVGGMSAIASCVTFAFLMAQLRRAHCLGATDILFLSCCQLAVLLLALCSFAWSLLHGSHLLCPVLPWIAFGPLALLIGTIVGRLLQVAMFYRAKGALTSGRLVGRFLAGYVSLVGVQLLLLVALTASSARPRASVTLLDWIDLVGQPSCVAGGDFAHVFGWISLGINLAAALACILMLLVGWKLIPIVSESRWLFLALYTCVLVCFVGILLTPSIPPLSLTTQMAVMGWLSVVLSLFWIPIYTAKLLHLKEQRVLKASTRSLESDAPAATVVRQRRVDISMSSEMDGSGVGIVGCGTPHAGFSGSGGGAVTLVEYPPAVQWQRQAGDASVLTASSQDCEMDMVTL